MPSYASGPVAELADAAVFKTETFAGCAGSNPAGATNNQGEDMPRGKNVSDLQARLDIVQREIDRIGRELEKARANEALLLDMIRERRGEPVPAATRNREPRFNVKRTVLELLGSAGEDGLNAAMAVEVAAKQGKPLERGSVSSVLSRLSKDNVVHYDGKVYRLAQWRGEGGTIHQLRTSGDAA